MFTKRQARPRAIALRRDDIITFGEADERQTQNYYRVFAPGIPDARVISERFTSEADAQSAKRTILMMYPAATVKIEKTDEEGRGKRRYCSS